MGLFDSLKSGYKNSMDRYLDQVDRKLDDTNRRYKDSGRKNSEYESEYQKRKDSVNRARKNNR